MTTKEIQDRLRSFGSPESATFAARYFKAGPGQYGEGDIFLGIGAPVMHKLAREYQTIPLNVARSLLPSEVQEDGLLSLLILVRKFQQGDQAIRQRIYDLYLANTRHLNNWDLLDCSARNIVGVFLADRDRSPLDNRAKSVSLWERRIGIIATFHFIRSGEFEDTLRIAEMLLTDQEDLIHKAVGWMLRKVGKRDQETLETFLQRCHRRMPRTMLRYAIGRFPEDLRRGYMQGKPNE